MSTNLAIRSTQNASPNVDLSVLGVDIIYDMITTFGANSTEHLVDTVAGGTEILWVSGAGGQTVAWISGRVPAGGFTLSSTALSAWFRETHMNANAGGRFRVFKYTPGSPPTLTELGGGPFNDGVEFATSVTEMTWAGNVTDTAFAEDDRIVVKIYVTNVGTMGAFQAGITFNSASASTGDSFFQIAETVAFKSEVVAAEFDAAVTCSVTTASALTTEITLSASVSATVTVASQLTTEITMVAGVTASATVGAELTTEITLAGAVTATVTAAAELTAPQTALFDAAVSVTASATAALTTEITMAAAIAATATASGTLTTEITLAAGVSGTITVSAELTTEITLGASVTGTATAVAELTTSIALDGAAIATVTATAQLTTPITFDGSALATATAIGDLTTEAPVASDLLSGGRRWRELLTRRERHALKIRLAARRPWALLKGSAGPRRIYIYPLPAPRPAPPSIVAPLPVLDVLTAELIAPPPPEPRIPADLLYAVTVRIHRIHPPPARIQALGAVHNHARGAIAASVAAPSVRITGHVIDRVTGDDLVMVLAALNLR